MAITNIHVSNFKSFNELDVKLGKFNVLIGANASGKSNFVQIFKFLRDIVNYGLINAISLQGGVEYLRNFSVKDTNNLSIKLNSNYIFRRPRSINDDFVLLKLYENEYEFSLRFKGRQKGGTGFTVTKDETTQKYEILKLEQVKDKLRETEKIGSAKVNLGNVDGKIDIKVDPTDLPFNFEEMLSMSLIEQEKIPTGELLLENKLLWLFFGGLSNYISDISIYDFDPKLLKKASSFTGKAELEGDGSNLSIVVNNIIKDKEKLRKFYNLIKNLLPFIDSLSVETFVDRSLMIKLRETYFENQNLPAPMISDGTINLIALLVALYFEYKPITIIEEPERNIHPYLISRLVDMMKDASQKKQVIVTTHNPELIKYAGLENILLMTRDENGFSKISRPIDNEEIKIFLQNEIGIDELYVQNLLGS